MAHSTNIISSIKLPNGNTYEIHDSQAIHSVEELGLSGALRFMGVKKTEEEVLALTSAKVGDVWLVDPDENAVDGVDAVQVEYVCVEAISGTAKANAWEKLGNVHDAASSNHTHGVTVTGENTASTVTGTVTVPTVSKTQKYLTATNAAPTVTPTTTTITASASGTTVAADGTAAAITALGTPNKEAVLGADTTFTVSGGTASTSKMVTTTVKNPSVTAVSIPNVTANTSVTASKVSNAGSKTNGTAASWTASVTNGVLSFDWTANTPTEVTLPTFTDVTATNTALGTALSASKVTTSDVTVATGALASNGAGSSVATGVSAVSVAVNDADVVDAITGFGKHTTANALTGVKVTAQPTITVTNGSNVMTGVTVAPSAITLTEADATSTGAVPVVSGVTIGSTSVNLQNGSAAAQKWAQKSGSTTAPN